MVLYRSESITTSTMLNGSSVGYVHSYHLALYQGPGIARSWASVVNVGARLHRRRDIHLMGELFWNTRPEADNRKSVALNSIGISIERSGDLRSVMYRHFM